MRDRARLISVGLTALACLLAAPARATDYALPRANPSFAGDPFTFVPSADVPGAFTFHASAIVDYARAPLVFGSSELVSHQLLLHGNITLALLDRVALNLVAPGVLYQYQSSTTSTSTSSVAFGDVRLGLRGRIYGTRRDLFQLGIGGYLWFPSGTNEYVTDGAFRGWPHIAASGQYDRRLVWSLAVGPEIRKKQTYLSTLTVGTSLTAGAGVAGMFLDDRALKLGLEFYFSQLLIATSSQDLAAELLLTSRYRFLHDFEVGLGGGPGLSNGIGTPTFRVFGLFAYSPELDRALFDRDGDGVLDKADACPRYPGEHNDDPVKNGCPKDGPPLLRDSDGDDVPDVEDDCPLIPGVRQDTPKQNGCVPAVEKAPKTQEQAGDCR